MADENMNSDASSDDKLWAALAYVFSPFIPIIILLLDTKKDRPYIRKHNVQALIAGLLIYLVIVPFTLGCGLVVWFVMFFWAYQAYQGIEVNIPLITDFAKKQGWA